MSDQTEHRTEVDELAGLPETFKEYFDEVDAVVAAITPNEIEARLNQLLNGTATSAGDIARQLISDASAGNPVDGEVANSADSIDLTDATMNLISHREQRPGGRHAAGPPADGSAAKVDWVLHERLEEVVARMTAEAQADLSAAEARANAAEARAAEAERRAAVAMWEVTVARVQAENATKEAQEYLAEVREYRHAAVERAGRIVAKAHGQAAALTDRASAVLEAAMARASQIVADANTLADYIRVDSRRNPSDCTRSALVTLPACDIVVTSTHDATAVPSANENEGSSWIAEPWRGGPQDTLACRSGGVAEERLTPSDSRLGAWYRRPTPVPGEVHELNSHIG